MAYTIIKTNGTVLTTIADGTLNNTSTSLDLPGRNYAGYGVIMDNNLVHLLENFANATVPSNPIRGQLWYNTATQSLYVCPTDNETDINNWYQILTTDDTTINALTISTNLISNNAYITNEISANLTTTNYLTVDNDATVSGTLTAPAITSNNITSGATLGQLTGNWNVTANLSATKIKSDDYSYANGVSINFDQAVGNTNEIQYNIGDSLSASANLTFDPGTNELSVIGNISASNYSGNGTGLENIPGANITGTLNSLVQGNITTTGTLGALTVTGTATVGNLSTSGNVSATNLTGTLTTASQPNITSLGTLTQLASNGTVVFANASSVQLGPIANVKVLGGTNGYLLATNGSGDLSFVNPASLTLTAAGTPTQIQFNNSGTLGASSDFTFNNSSKILSVVGNIVSGNATLGNTALANFFQGNGYNLTSVNGSNIVGQAPNSIVAGTVYTAAQPNITSVGTLTSLIVSGTITSSGANLGTNAEAVNFIGANVNITTVNATGNVNSGNASLGNTATAAYFVGDGSKLTNITGGNVTGTVPSATVAASANSVAGANVTGTVANATFATTAGVANSVAGANVTGTVANATYSTSAGSATTATTASFTTTQSSSDNSTKIASTAFVKNVMPAVPASYVSTLAWQGRFAWGDGVTSGWFRFNIGNVGSGWISPDSFYVETSNPSYLWFWNTAPGAVSTWTVTKQIQQRYSPSNSWLYISLNLDWYPMPNEITIKIYRYSTIFNSVTFSDSNRTFLG